MSQYISTSTTFKPKVVLWTFSPNRSPNHGFIGGVDCPLLQSANKYLETSLLMLFNVLWGKRTVRSFMTFLSCQEFMQESRWHPERRNGTWSKLSSSRGPWRAPSGKWKAKILKLPYLACFASKREKELYLWPLGCRLRPAPPPCWRPTTCWPVQWHAGGQARHDHRHAGRHPHRLGDHDEFSHVERGKAG